MRLPNLALQFATLLGLAGFIGVAACSSDDPATPAGCADSRCITGNKCVDNGKSTECRLVCTSQADCPSKYKCVANPKGDQTYCAPDEGFAAQITPKDKGQWGALCNPSGGLDANPDCDTDQSFWCYGQTPTDASAFCTQYQCTSDAECKGGYWCAPINVEPSVRRNKRSVKETTTACLPRSYCSTCTSDVDCPARDGSPQYCVAGTDDKKFCTSECQNDTNCRLDASCVEAGDRKVCKPRAGVCKGDGTFCAPCYADSDCADDSACILSAYSRERFCSPKSKITCALVNDQFRSDCPDAPKLEGIVGVGCETSRDSPDAPKDYCLPYVQYGKEEENVIPGCWTRKR